jgi:hypothetical protein
MMPMVDIGVYITCTRLVWYLENVGLVSTLLVL